MLPTLASTVVIAFLMAVASSQPAHAAAKVYVGLQAPSGQQVSMDRIHHSAWDAIVRKYVDEAINATAFFADRSKFRYDASRRTIQVSPILKWFASAALKGVTRISVRQP